MKIGCTLLLAGTAIWSCSTIAAAATPPYFENFESGTVDQLKTNHWDFSGVVDGKTTLDTKPDSLVLDDKVTPITPPTRFLGEFGHNDQVRLTLSLSPLTESVRIQFDAYLLRTWDGAQVEFAGPDTFGYGIEGRAPIVENTFSNGLGVQDYCPGVAGPTTCAPTTGSDFGLKNKIGFEVRLEPPPPDPNGPPRPPVGTDMSLVYHFDSGPIAFTGDQVTFDFFSKNLQTNFPFSGSSVLDESWGLDNIHVTAALVPEPQTWALLLTGVLFLGYSKSHRRRPSR